MSSRLVWCFGERVESVLSGSERERTLLPKTYPILSNDFVILHFVDFILVI